MLTNGATFGWESTIANRVGSANPLNVFVFGSRESLMSQGPANVAAQMHWKVRSGRESFLKVCQVRSVNKK